MITTAALALLVIVLLVAASARFWVAMGTAVAAMLVFNAFFLAPVGKLTIADPQNWAAFVAFISAALIVSQLSSAAQRRETEALINRNELARLFDLSRDVLLTGESGHAVDALARHIVRRFELPSAVLLLKLDTGWSAHQGADTPLIIAEARLEFALRRAGHTLEFDARERAYGGQATAKTIDGVSVALVPLRLGTKPIGLLAVPSGSLAAGSLDAIAGLAAIAIERVDLVGKLKAAELVRQKADFTSTLLASLSHDLRTPLTAIQVAITNLQNHTLTDEAQRDQVRVAEAELGRLSRLFRDILDMARIDAESLSPEREWVTPSDVIDAALANLGTLLKSRPLKVDANDGVLVNVDPRLTSAALSHLIENAAQYSPPTSTIEISGTVGKDGLELSVADHGSGLDPVELPQLFERFYRGRREQARSAGTGMGLAITRGLLAVEQGRVWGENTTSGGARFSIAIPASQRSIEADV